MAEDNEENSCLILKWRRGWDFVNKRRTSKNLEFLCLSVISAAVRSVAVWISPVTWQVQGPQNKLPASLFDSKLI